jgi:WGR domain
MIWIGLQNRIIIDAIILHRTDPAKNMRRFYWLDVQPDLFRAWCQIREWGRFGSWTGAAREGAPGVENV